jgi:hypothetical protein
MKILRNFKLSLIYLLMIVSVANLSFIGCSSDNNSTDSPPTGPRVVISPQPLLYFGQIPEGHETYREFKISNSGDQTLIIERMVIEGTDPGLFTLSDSGQIELGEIESAIIEVTFSPLTDGSFTAQVKIESNAASSPDYFDFKAEGTPTTGGSITFERIIGGQENDGASSVQITNNGGYIVAGNTLDPINDFLVATLTMLDKYGNFLWTKQYPGDGTSAFSSVVIADDGGFVATGRTATSNLSANKVFVVKTDDDGNNANWWTFGAAGDEASEIEKTNDGGYIIAGFTVNTGVEDDLLDAMLIKLDGVFTQVWLKNYGTKTPGEYKGEDARSVKQTADGGFIFAGSQSDGVPDVYLVKTDADGDIIWEKTYGGSDWDVANDIFITNDGGYVMAGFTIKNARDVFVVKTDSAGTEQWSENYGGSSNDEGAAIVETSDQGFLIVGGTKSSSVDGDEDVYIIKTDGSGSQIWDMTYGGNGSEGASCVRKDTPPGFIISGSTGSFSRSTDMYILKTDSDGEIGE